MFESNLLNENLLFICIFFVISKQKFILFFFLTTVTSELSKYLSEQLGVLSNVKQQKLS